MNTMRPYADVECFVLKDGGVVDLELRNYERFLSGVILTKLNSITPSKVYYSVISKEEKGEYLGKPIEINPHFTDEIQRMIMCAISQQHQNNGKPIDVCIIELGCRLPKDNTYPNPDTERIAPFIEALYQLKCKK